MPRADNSSRKYELIQSEDKTEVERKKEDPFPYRRMNEILRDIQNRLASLEGLGQPPTLRNHLTILAPPTDPGVVPGTSDQSTLFHDISARRLKVCDPGQSSYGAVVNHIGLWTNTTGVTVNDTRVVWDTEEVGDLLFRWSSTTESIGLTEPGRYDITAKIRVLFTAGPFVLALRINGTVVQTARVGATFQNVPFVWVHEKKTPNTIVDTVDVDFQAGTGTVGGQANTNDTALRIAYVA